MGRDPLQNEALLSPLSTSTRVLNFLPVLIGVARGMKRGAGAPTHCAASARRAAERKRFYIGHFYDLTSFLGARLLLLDVLGT